MTDELQVAVVNTPDVVVVPQTDVEVLSVVEQTPVVITSPEMEVVTVNDEVHIVDQVKDIQVVTVGEAGPRGAPGDVPAGTTTGDVIRYNASTGAWETYHEPLEFAGIILTPAEAALTVAEGAIFYKASEKNIQVCTDAV